MEPLSSFTLLYPYYRCSVRRTSGSFAPGCCHQGSSGLGSVRFHDLRHTFASLMLLRGAKPKVISEALGYASVAFTMDTYSHIISGMQEDAMALLDEVLPPGVALPLQCHQRPGAAKGHVFLTLEDEEDGLVNVEKDSANFDVRRQP